MITVLQSYLYINLAYILVFYISQRVLGFQEELDSVLLKETEIWQRALKEIKDKDIRLRGFYHTSVWAPYWKDVFMEQLYLLDGLRVPHKWDDDVPSNATDYDIDGMVRTNISLLSATNQLYVNVAGYNSTDLDTVKEFVTSLNLKFIDQIHLNFNKTASRGAFKRAQKAGNITLQEEMLNDENLSEGESSTVMSLHQYCKNEIIEGRKAYVFYIHSKGSCCIRGKPQVSYKVEPVASWREGMNTFNIEFPSICLRALNKGYSGCGMEYQHAHYSGNFWWANCEHIAALPALQNRFDAWESEFFLYGILRRNRTGGRVGAINRLLGENCGYDTHRCLGIHRYDDECPRAMYRDNIIQYVSDYELPPNDVATLYKKNNFSWVAKNCGELRKIPYESQEWFETEDQDKFRSLLL